MILSPFIYLSVISIGGYESICLSVISIGLCINLYSFHEFICKGQVQSTLTGAASDVLYIVYIAEANFQHQSLNIYL